MSLVRAISSGARIAPATPAAETVTAREERGDGEESMSKPPMLEDEPELFGENDSPGSGSARRAVKRDRTNDVMVERRIECTYVLFVPFQMPHAPSTFHTADSVERIEEDDLRFSRCEDGGFRGGDRGGCTRGMPSGLDDGRRRRPRGMRVGV